MQGAIEITRTTMTKKAKEEKKHLKLMNNKAGSA